MSPTDFDFIRGIVRDDAAIVLEPGKEYLVESRLLTLANREHYASIDDLVGKLRAAPLNGLRRKVVDIMTTNETSFFRDLHPFEALRQVLLPELMARRAADRSINFWCGAASTGQEPFSVLMTIAEHFPAMLNWNLNFVATDLSLDVLERARAGRFNQLEVNRGLPASLLVKYFTRQGAEWEFSPELRRRVQFKELNLVKEWPHIPPTDIVFLRNVLIYFDLDTKRTILGKVRRILRPGGCLLLGGAESTLNIDDGFERTVVVKTPCHRVK